MELLSQTYSANSLCNFLWKGENNMKRSKTPKILSVYDLQDVEAMLEADMIEDYEEGFMRGYMTASSS